jgi:regulation of enolase protein 1 (concanavalin A-like superfamily)
MSYFFENGKWLNKPRRSILSGECMTIRPEQHTDFWKKTSNGKESDNGHFMYLNFECGFELEAEVVLSGEVKGDEAGLMIRIDENHWIKTALQFINEMTYQVKVVVTNCGFSDESTHLIHLPKEVRLKVGKDADDYYVEVYFNERWTQLRVCHLIKESEFVAAGIFACSPRGEDVSAKFSQIRMCEYCE